MSLFRRKKKHAEAPADRSAGASVEPARDEPRGESTGPPAATPPAPGEAETPESEPGSVQPGNGPSPPRSGVRGVLRSTREALAPVEKKHIFVASFGLMGIMTAVVFLASALSFWWTSQPSFCGRCHVMATYIQAWERSAHQDVNCESCHLVPGFFGFIGGKIAGLQVVMNYIRGNYEDWSFNAAVPNVACIQCHEEILEKNLHGDETGITVSHSNIVELGGKCMNCHSTVAHGGAVPIGSETHPTMASCLRCHNDTTAPLDCALCHTGKQPLAEMPVEETAAGGT